METIDTVRKGLSTDPDAALSNNGNSNPFFTLTQMLHDADMRCS